jgi:peptidoglycan/xylan/chitin deacetylase (PgdA/CDA1 family)
MPSRWTAALLGAAVLLAGCGSGARPRPVNAHRVARPARRGTPARGIPTIRRHSQGVALLRFTRLGRPVFCGGRGKRLVALTFDDGPGPYTRIALRELRRAGARATFFLVGRSIRRFPGLPRRERALAAIGDHTMTHPFLPGLSARAARAEIADARALAAAASGTRIRLFRPPYGAHTPAIDRDVSRLGMVEVLWDVDSTDSRVWPPANFHAIARVVRRAVRPGSIVLFHENRGQTIRALRTILPMLARRRLRAVTVPELLAQDPPSAAALARGAAGCGVRSVTGVGG